MILSWIGIVVGLLSGFLAIWIAESATKYDEEHHEWCRNHPNARLTRSFHTDIMAGYWTAVIVIGGIALAVVGISVMGLIFE